MKIRKPIHNLSFAIDFDGRAFMQLHRAEPPSGSTMERYGRAFRDAESYLSNTQWHMLSDGTLARYHLTTLPPEALLTARVVINDSDNLDALCRFGSFFDENGAYATVAAQGNWEILIEFPDLAEPGKIDHLKVEAMGPLYFKRRRMAFEVENIELPRKPELVA